VDFQPTTVRCSEDANHGWQHVRLEHSCSRYSSGYLFAVAGKVVDSESRILKACFLFFALFMLAGSSIFITGCGTSPTAAASTASSAPTPPSEPPPAQHQVTLDWDAPTDSPIPVVGYDVYRAPAGSSAFQLLNTTVDSQTTYVDMGVGAGDSYTYYVTSVGDNGLQSPPSTSADATIPN